MSAALSPRRDSVEAPRSGGIRRRPRNGRAGDTPPNVFGRGSAILADGKLIALGEAGLLGLFKPNSEKLEELSRWQVPKLTYPCWAAPALANGRLYLRDESWVVCYDLHAPGGPMKR